MDYQAFYNEIVAWINEVNIKAAQWGMDSSDFWSWVTYSIGELSDKYDNNPLVIKQMVMMHEWLEDIYYKR